MTLEEQIKKTEQMFPMAFSQSIQKDYGILYYDDDNKDSHDSNHAILFEKEFDLTRALTEIRAFYEKRGIVPRVNHPFQEDFFERNRSHIQSLGFKIKSFGSNCYMYLSEKNTLKPKGSLTILRITEWDKRIATDIFIPVKEEHEIPLFRKAVGHKNCHVLVAYQNGEAVAVALFHTLPTKMTRVDYIITAINHRNKGYARELVSYLVDYCQKNGIEQCYLLPAHKTAEKIYHEAGFRTIFEAEAGVAIYNSLTQVT